MKKKSMVAVGILLLAGFVFVGCAGKSNEENAAKENVFGTELSYDTQTDEAFAQDENASGEARAELPDGAYTAEFDTDSSMFHVNEANDGKGILTVEDGEMTIHISLVSKNIVNLYLGLAEDAQKDGAELLSPTVDEVTYSDGTTEEVYGFDVPVPALDEEFDLALIGTKGVWYDHKVTVSNPQALQEETEQKESIGEWEDGTYTMELTLEGGSGKAQVLSPATIVVSQGAVTASVQWSSPNYDYMIVDGVKYLPVNTEGNSVFEIPVRIFDEPIDVVGDTVAMSTPHEIAYTLTFYSDTMQMAE